MRIAHKHIKPILAATTRLVIHKRLDIQQRLSELAREVPDAIVAGPPFCVFNFISSVVNGYDVTVGIPVVEPFVGSQLEIEQLSPLEVLSTIHRGDPSELTKIVSDLFAYANQFGLISDEFYREIYLDESHPEGSEVEIQFVVHNWNAKLADGIERVLGVASRNTLMLGSEALEIESGIEARFQWVKEMLSRLNETASESQKYDILSGCAHVFPQTQVDKLAQVYAETRRKVDDPLTAVDAVIQLMEQDPGWVEGGRRKGYTIYAVKPPRDRQAFDSAKTELERRQSYCFCPVLRTCMDQGMPVEYCYCGSGWFRQQWEGAIGHPVKIDIVRSVLRGDDACEFAIHLPNDI